MIISLSTEKAFDKIKHPLMKKKTFNRLGIKRNFLNLKNSNYEKPTAVGIANSERPNTFPLKLDKARVFTFTDAIQPSTKSSSQCKKQGKEIKGIQIGK